MGGQEARGGKLMWTVLRWWMCVVEVAVSELMVCAVHSVARDTFCALLLADCVIRTIPELSLSSNLRNDSSINF